MTSQTSRAIVALLLIVRAIAVAQGSTETKTGYAAVHGLKMYYRIQAPAHRSCFFHGALSNIDTDFGRLLPEFTKNRKVIAAADTAELLRQLKIEKADFFGYSMGGGIVLELAMRHAGLVRTLVWAGGVSYTPDGLYTVIRDGAKDLKPELLAGSPWQKAYTSIAPDPSKWSGLVFKIRDLDMHFGGWTSAEVRAVQAPALLIIGDSDIVRPEHVVEMFRLLGGGVPGDVKGLPRSQIAILPGTLMSRSLSGLAG